jgi:hypothetical protein
MGLFPNAAHTAAAAAIAMQRSAVNVAAGTESFTKQFRVPVIATAAVISALSAAHEYRLRPLGEVIVYGSPQANARSSRQATNASRGMGMP